MARRKESSVWEEYRKRQNNDMRYKNSVEGSLAKINEKHKRKKRDYFKIDKDLLKINDPFKT
jgi:hypothetical protein